MVFLPYLSGIDAKRTDPNKPPKKNNVLYKGRKNSFEHYKSNA